MASSSAVRRPRLPPPAQYGRDAYSWAMEQARLIRAGRFDEIDVENVAEEIESVGRSERKALRSALARTIQHMLKWDFQPEKRSPSWQSSIAIHRVHARRELRDNPGLKGELSPMLDDAFDIAALKAAKDTKLPRTAFPVTCPYSLDQVLGEVA